MGYLQNSDTIVKNAMNELDKILQSGSSISITGLGEPVLVTWYNVNDKLSTTTAGIDTVDAIIGYDSPFRYNRVENQPVYGVTKELQNIEMRLDDNGIMDMDVELDPVIPPGTIVPNAFDHMVYTYASGRNVTFRINNIQIATLRSGGFYKVPMHLVDIDSKDYTSKLEKLTVKELQIDLDNVGTNEKCIVSNKVFDEIKKIDKLSKQMMEDYIDTFFSRKYNSFIFRGYNGGQLTVYDPYLTKFLLNHRLIELYDEILEPYVIDQDETFRSEYNKTVFRALEMHDAKRINELLYEVKEFSRKKSNPFDYWGEETVYSLHAYQDKEAKYPKNNYMDFNWLYYIETVKESNSVTMLENLIIRFFQHPTFEKFMTLNELSELERLSEPDYTETYFYLVPMVLYILGAYKKYLYDSNL